MSPHAGWRLCFGRTRGLLAAAGLALVAWADGAAQDLEPRLYTNAPVGMNFIVGGYSASEGGVLIDPTLPVENAELEFDGPVFAYARALRFAADSAQVAIAIGNVCLDGSADYQGQRYTRDVCGWTDTKVRLAWNFAGAPAGDLREFASYSQDLIVGASMVINVPTGDYDSSRLANIGTNRWALKAELGLSKAIERWILELAVAGTYFETNESFFGDQTRRQEPVYSLQGHVIRGFRSGVWLALDWTYYRGGATVTGGIANRNLQANSRAGLTLSFPINRKQSIKLSASTGVATRTGSDFDTLAAAWQYRWGGGL
jgi:hypothetical protein